MTIRELARQAGLSHASIAYYASGERTPKTEAIKKIEAVLRSAAPEYQQSRIGRPVKKSVPDFRTFAQDVEPVEDI